MKKQFFRIIGLMILTVIIQVKDLKSQTHSEYIRFQRLSLEQGLSQSTVNDILLDQRGFLWIATQDGLNQYDGYEFKVFKFQPDDTNSIPNNFIYSLQEDTLRHCLWVATHGGGLAKVNFSSGLISRLYHRDGDTNSLADNYLYPILLNHENKLWIGTRDKGLDLYDPDQKHISHYRFIQKNGNSVSHNRIRTLFEDSRDRLWVGTDKGLLLYDRKEKRFKEALSQYINNIPVLKMTEDRSGNIWIGTDGLGLFRYDPTIDRVTIFSNHSPAKQSITNNTVRTLLIDNEQQLWIGTGYGLNRINLLKFSEDNEARFEYFLSSPSDVYSLSNNIIQSLIIDRFNNLWIGTNGGGLNKYSKSIKSFKLYTNKSFRSNNVNLDDVLSIVTDNSGILWAGTWGEGLFAINPEDNTVRVFRHEEGKTGGLSDNSVFALMPDSGNVLWAGTYNGLSRLENRGTGKNTLISIKNYMPDPDRTGRLNHPRIRCIARLKNGMMWLGTYGGGINIFNPKSGRFDVLRNIPENPNSLSNDNIWVIHEDTFGDIWIGTYGGGLNRYNPLSGQWTRYIHEPYSTGSISNDVVLSIYSDSAEIWLGTRAGLNVMDRATGKFRCLTTRQGLPNDVIYGILADRHQNLWVSTNNGISKITRTGDSVFNFRNYDINSGLQGNEFNIGAHYQSPNGEMFFGGINGFNSFFPEDIIINETLPPVSITAFKKFDRIIISAPFTDYIHVFELSHRENYFSLEFAALDFTDPNKNQYAYILEGFDEDWVFCGSRRYASYTNLDGGTYRFKVKGTNHDGFWNDQSASVQIVIHPPVWKTMWFRIITLMAVTALFAYSVHWRFRSIQNQKRMLEEQVRQRTAEVTDKNTRLQSALDEIQDQKNSLNAINLQLTQALEELKQSQNQLIQSEKMAALGHLVGGIAHEINNPLSFIDGNLTYFNDYMNNAVRIINETELRLRTSESKSTEELIRSIEELKNKYDYQFIVSDMVNLLNACRHGTQRIKKIVDDLRHFSSTDESRLISSDIHHCIDQAIISINHLFNEKIEIIKEYGSLPYVMCYPGLLTHAIRHIILNAVQAIEENGIISVRTFVDAGLPVAISPSVNTCSKIEIEISDNGQGIPEKIKHRIFDPFFTTRTIGQGTGLGLTIAYNIIKQHDGTLTFSSEERKGSVFNISIPLKTKQQNEI